MTLLPDDTQNPAQFRSQSQPPNASGSPVPRYRPPHKAQPAALPKLATPSWPRRRAPPALTAYGDSFVGPLELLGDRVIVNKYSGASAKGLNNPNSVSGTGPAILWDLDRYRPSKVLLIFGHVDLQVVYLWKTSESQRLGDPPPCPVKWVDTVFAAYTSYIVSHVLPHVAPSGEPPHPDRFITHVYISSVTMPTVPDEFLDQCSEKYNESSAEAWQTLGIKLADCVAPTDFETRRWMVRSFNARLEEFCAPETGEVKELYLVPDKSTIHVVWETTIEFWVRELEGSGLTMEDIPKDLKETQKQYEEEKRGRMERRSPARLTSTSFLAAFLIYSQTPRKQHSRHGSTPSSPTISASPLSPSSRPLPPVTPIASPTPRPGIYRPPHLLRSKDTSPVSPSDSPRGMGHKRQVSLPMSALEGSPASPLRTGWTNSPTWRQKS